MMAATAAPLRRGSTLAPGYTVAGHICRNEASDVYDVWSEDRMCRCVAKILRPDRRHESRPRERLITEGHLLQRLTHPHLVRAYDTIEDPHPMVILEPLTGANLEDLIDAAPRRLPVRDLAYLGLQLCSAVQYLHRNGILHLDLKPDNVIAQGGLAKLLDLSLARPPGRAARGRGTREYLAPEQATGDELSEATDVWGLGVTLYEAATRCLPFEQTRNGARYPQLVERAVPVRTHRRLPRRLADAIDVCLAPEPDRRPPLAALMQTLNQCAAEAPSPWEPRA